MRKIIILFFLISKIAESQDMAQCIKVVEATAKAINSKSSNALDVYLSDDFSMANQTGSAAKRILPNLITQLGDSLLSFEKISETKTEVLTLVYDFVYKSRGKKTSTFVFNAQNQLKALTLFKMEVKMMKAETNVKKSAANVISIPFKRVRKLILVQAILDGVKRNFILDNGAPKLMLNSKYTLKHLDTNAKIISNAKGINSNISGLDIAKLGTFDFSSISVNNQDVIAMDLSHLETELKTEIYGLIGYEIYKDYDMLFDYKTNTLTLLNPETTAVYLDGKFDKNRADTIPIAMEREGQHLAIITVNIASKNYKLAIDCGAETNLLGDSLFTSLKSEMRRVKTDKLSGADKLVKIVQSGKLKALKLGQREFKNLKTVFSSTKQISEGYKVHLDGIIGFEVLSKQKTLLSYHKKQLIFLN